MESLIPSLGDGSILRRQLLKFGAASYFALNRLTAVAKVLAEQEATSARRSPAQSLIVLWLAGGPSQLETFDPHPGQAISGGTQAVESKLRDTYLAAGLERSAEQLDVCTLVRNVVSREGDHERGTYLLKTGYSPDPTLVHPSVGAICCHQLPASGTEIPRHISILPDRFPARGGYLGNQYDAFKTFDPIQPVPDVTAFVRPERLTRRSEDADIVEEAFARGRRQTSAATLHRQLMQDARAMMTSEQLSAFDVRQESKDLQAEYGETPFGRGCLAARRLIEVGVRCVEVTLGGWDTHVNNHEGHRTQLQILDPALSALLADLKRRDLLNRTLVICGGEFGRTPTINPLGGRDHWPHGFSMLLAGGRLRRGLVHGATDPQGSKISKEQGVRIADLHATLFTALGIDPHHEEVVAGIGRPMKLTEGNPLPMLLD